MIRYRFDPWVGKIPWRRAQEPTPVFLPVESYEDPGGLQSMHGVAKTEMDMTEVT